MGVIPRGSVAWHSLRHVVLYVTPRLWLATPARSIATQCHKSPIKSGQFSDLPPASPRVAPQDALFGPLFPQLFGGGEALLARIDCDDPREAGLEIMCQPPGKKLSTLSLLSGGEQTLTALALIFAVFLANPAPICVLDEVDAPLDDANVTRFCDLLDEMTRRTETRFLIITHHAVTMSRMDRLFGVTMAEQGVSQLVSVDLKKAEQMVA